MPYGLYASENIKMSNIVDFPTWLFKKERELNELAHNLEVEKYSIENEKYYMGMEKSALRSKILASFAAGVIVGVLIPMLAIFLI
jgi:hypothetical protein